MKMNLIQTGFILILTTMGITARAQAAPAQVDFNAVNSIIQEVIAESVIPDEVIKEVALTFSPASNLEQGKIGARFTSIVGVTPWEKNQDSQINLQLGTRFEDVNSLWKEGAFKIKTQAKTPVLEMIRYFSTKALQNRSPQNIDHYETLKKLSEVTDINGLYQIAVEIRKILVEDANHREKREFLQNLRFTTKKFHGRVVSFKIEQTKPLIIDFFGKLEIRMAAIAIDSNSMSAGLVIATVLDTTTFNRFVEQTTVYLVELQERNEKSLRNIKSTISGYIEFVRDFLNN